ncbi:methyltransferase domain-containing protein [Paenibacillus sp. ACRRX]|uniref:class I SAM-dependent DNA methyltransferase n=1 Tax=Paenibacillus sp. ACRRX TaxID=2918206 RepID=UPI001EF667D2|nr:class I SAM-dependent methyltransferase [Paenibacillus sp. ACRRX]MCG7407338.1 methyltransferase domain-containing protein [Paenibacillus sp. ACRRX]
MTQRGYEFYDNQQTFDNYIERRSWNDNVNDTIEKPIVMEMIGNVGMKHICDLGCGTGSFGNELLDLGASSYIGIEGSQNMVARSKQVLNRSNSKVIHTAMEDWMNPTNTYDLVISRLALHYIEDLDALFGKVFASLCSGGSFVFSVEHPVMTSSFGMTRQEGLKQDWIVDGYFDTGVRKQEWLGGIALKFHRTVEDYYVALQGAGFVVGSLRESKPRRVQFANEEAFLRRMRIPLFLFLEGNKN